MTVHRLTNVNQIINKFKKISGLHEKSNKMKEGMIELKSLCVCVLMYEVEDVNLNFHTWLATHTFALESSSKKKIKVKK